MTHSPRRILLGTAALAASAAATLGVVVFLGGDAHGHEPATPVGFDVPKEDRTAPVAAQRTTSTAPAPGAASAEPQSAGALPAGDEVGEIRGRLAINTRILDKLRDRKFQITVEEDRNPNAPLDPAAKPFKAWRRFPFDFSLGTPMFDFAVPFSRYPYRVTVTVPGVGVDGSSAITQVNEDYPTGKDEVTLSISPGAYYTVQVIDQRRNPREGLRVLLAPIGENVVERRWHDGTTNNYGTVVFEDVQRGQYKVCVGSADAPMAPPIEVDVRAEVSISRGRPHVQHTRVTVPDGRAVRVEVFSKYGAVLPGARITALQLEVKTLNEVKGETDRAGILEFENLAPGVYQLGVEAANHGRRDQRIKIENDGQGPIVIKVVM